MVALCRHAVVALVVLASAWAVAQESPSVAELVGDRTGPAGSGVEFVRAPLSATPEGNTNPVPEPVTLALGAMALGVAVRRRARGV